MFHSLWDRKWGKCSKKESWSQDQAGIQRRLRREIEKSHQGKSAFLRTGTCKAEEARGSQRRWASVFQKDLNARRHGEIRGSWTHVQKRRQNYVSQVKNLMERDLGPGTGLAWWNQCCAFTKFSINGLKADRQLDYPGLNKREREIKMH